MISSQRPAIASSMAVVDNLVEQVMEPFDIGIADIHPRTKPNRFQTFQYGNIIFGILQIGCVYQCILLR